MPIIPLDRQFIEWRDGEPSDPDAWAQLGFSHGLSWNDLLNKRRVVVLAEARSGKTEELEAQAALLRADGKFSFYAKVQDVGRDGLRSALRIDDRTPAVSRRSGELWRQIAELEGQL